MDQETTNCTHCQDVTNNMGTKLCDQCWELDRRIRENQILARRILVKIERENRLRSLAPATFSLSEAPKRPK